MADRRRLVRRAWDGTVTVVRDLEDTTSYYAIRDSFTVVPGARSPVTATVARRYAGARTVAESHQNGTVSWKMAVRGATPQAALSSVEALLGDLEAADDPLWLEWRPEGAAGSVYYELRGPVTWTPNYRWVEFAAARTITVDVQLPVAPLACGDQQTVSVPATSMPASVALPADVAGWAPALVDLEVAKPASATAPVWALIGWTARPGAALAGTVAPFGLIEAETAGTLVGFAAAADAAYRGGNGLKVTANGAGSASAQWQIDPSVLSSDDFTAGEVDVEVWARVQPDSSLVAPALTLSLLSSAGSAFGGEQFTSEFGSVGRQLVLPSANGVFRLTRLGTLSLPVDRARPLAWQLKLAAAWAAGSAGTLGLDYLVIVPARQRAVSVSGKPNDAGYAPFLASAGAATKTIRSDLSGLVASGAGNPARSPGLGGSPLEMPPGPVDMVVVLSDRVPDDPTASSGSAALEFTGVSWLLRVTPRYWLANPS